MEDTFTGIESRDAMATRNAIARAFGVRDNKPEPAPTDPFQRTIDALEGRLPVSGHKGGLYYSPQVGPSTPQIEALVGEALKSDCAKVKPALRKLKTAQDSKRQELDRVMSKSPLRYFSEQTDRLSQAILDGSPVDALDARGEAQLAGDREARALALKKAMALDSAAAMKLLAPIYEKAVEVCRDLRDRELRADVERHAKYGIAYFVVDEPRISISPILKSLQGAIKAFEERTETARAAAPTSWVPIEHLTAGLIDL